MVYSDCNLGDDTYVAGALKCNLRVSMKWHCTQPNVNLHWDGLLLDLHINKIKEKT